jgi:predicted RND superfamily exporter protein
MSVRLCRFLAHHRSFTALLVVVLTLPAAFFARRASLSSKMSDYYPGQHPHVRLYQEFAEMLKMTNTVVVTVGVREGTIYTPETLGKIHRITVDLLDTKGVNPFEVMSLTHPRLKDIKVRSAGISILPIVNHPEEPQPPEDLVRIKNAVYTNLGIRGIYVSPDDKTALIRAGFWDGMAEPRAVLTRLQTLAERESDANTDISFTGNLVLAAWLIEAAPRFLLLLIISAGVAIFLTGELIGRASGMLVVFLVNLLGALWGLGALGAGRLTFEPLALIMLFPLCARGITLVISWYARLASEYGAVFTPFSQETSREQALERTATALWRPLTATLSADCAALLVLAYTDVPVLQALGYLGAGWIAGLLLSLWTVLPLWSSLLHLHGPQAGAHSWGERLAARVATGLQGMLRPSAATRIGLLVLGLLGIAAAAQLQAGRTMLGTTLFYPSHPYNRAFALVNQGFIGVNQLIVIARTSGKAAFRDPKALQALEAFQHYMAEDDQFGGALAITSLTKSLTRMFHEDVPKWEIVPDDIDSAGQVIFRIVVGAATPSEVERFLSTDFSTTAVTLFYRNYSPTIVAHALDRAHEFITKQDGTGVEFRVGGGILGVLAAVHDAVESSYWRTLGVLVLLAGVAAFLGLGSLRAAFAVIAALALSQGVMLAVLWLGNIDFNVYTLPVVVVSAGVILTPMFLARTQDGGAVRYARAFAATSLTLASAASVWLFSPLRLQAEMGVFLIVLALVHTVIPLGLQKRLASVSLESRRIGPPQTLDARR